MTITSSTTLSTRFLKTEFKAITLLAGIFSLRMLGLFMILPIFAIAAQELEGASPQKIGIAIGIYGLMQALLQAPLGYISDRLGRKPVIALGLLLLSLGSIVAAMSHTILGVILGRCLQGSGAVGGVTMALLSDLTREEVRLKAMAIIGVSIGASFALAFIVGPLLNSLWGLSSIFWLIALFALLAIPFIPKNESDPILLSQKSESNNQFLFSKSKYLLIFNPQMLLAFFGVFVLHASLTSIFLELPLVLQNFSPKENQPFHFYLPVFLASIITTIPCISFLDKKQNSPKIFLFPLLVLILSFFIMILFLNSDSHSHFHLYSLSYSLWPLALSLYLFFTAFNILEASLPSYISKLAPAHMKGLALGVFSSVQFLGLCFGGIFGGWLNEHLGFLAVFIFCVILTMVWLIWVLFSNKVN